MVDEASVAVEAELEMRAEWEMRRAMAELALSAMRGGLGSFSPDGVLWCSRLLCRLAADLAHRGVQADTLWAFFSRPNGGAAMLRLRRQDSSRRFPPSSLDRPAST